jgi:hypothetical protein
MERRQPSCDCGHAHRKKILRKTREDITNPVVPKEIYPMYEYVQLRPENLAKLANKNIARTFSEADYVTQHEDCKFVCNQTDYTCMKIFTN